MHHPIIDHDFGAEGVTDALMPQFNRIRNYSDLTSAHAIIILYSSSNSDNITSRSQMDSDAQGSIRVRVRGHREVTVRIVMHRGPDYSPS